MPYTRPVVPPPPKRRPLLAALVCAGVVAALFFAMREAHLSSQARRNIPGACLIDLSLMPVEEARTVGLPLRDCSRRRNPPESRARLLGPWAYGHTRARVWGHIALLRETQPDGSSKDRLMHVRVEDSHLMLNDLTLEGSGCAGGIDDAYVKGANFGMTVNLTPEALLRFRPNESFERTYVPGDLATDASACAARLTLIDRRPVMIQLNPRTMTPAGTAAVAPDVSSRQGCFERQLGRYTAENRATLMFPDGHDVFVRDYVASCAPNPPPAPPKAAKPATRRKGR